MDISSDTSSAESLATLNICNSEIKSWLGRNRLKLSDTKTNVLILASPRYLHALKDNVMHVVDVSVLSHQFVKNIGIMFYHAMSMN